MSGWPFRPWRRPVDTPEVLFTGGSIERFVLGSYPVVAVCHPEWRGVSGATHALGVPVLESPNLAVAAPIIVETLRSVGAELLIVSGFPPGTEVLARSAAGADVRVRVLMHSSMAQHGAEPGEAAIIEAVAQLMRDGDVDALGFSKQGQAEAMTMLGVPSRYVPPRIAELAGVEKIDLGPGRHVGIFAAATWRKNVTTQLGAAALLGATAHVTALPPVDYLPGHLRIIEHHLLARDAFLTHLASVDLNLAVTLYECFPLLPQESFWLGVPCLVSRTSALFTGDEILERLVIVPEHDNAAAIATAGERLLGADGEEVIERARQWMRDWNTSTEAQRAEFLATTG